jgi:hypothetical protein
MFSELKQDKQDIPAFITNCPVQESGPRKSARIASMQGGPSSQARKQPYGLWSKFDGTSTTYMIIVDFVGYSPAFAVLCENDEKIRPIVADKHGLCLDPTKWQINKYGVPTIYLTDVWALVDNNGLVIRQALALFPDVNHHVDVGGSPCQDLTVMNEYKGILGVTGTRSHHFHIFPAFIQMLCTLQPIARIFLTIENAGSMQRLQQAYIVDVLQLQACNCKRLDAGTWGSVRRNRWFIGSTSEVSTPALRPAPWEPGWLPSQHQINHKLMPWLRSRGISARGNVIMTSGAYHPTNLLYHAESFGGELRLHELWVPSIADPNKRNCVPGIPWEQYVPEHLMPAWQTLLAWPIASRLYPNEAEDRAAALLADLFAEESESMPFRIPSIAEKERDSELAGYYACLGAAKPLLDQQRFVDLIGNFFKPSALLAALGANVTGNLNTFLQGNYEGITFPRPLPPAALNAAFSTLSHEVVKSLQSTFTNDPLLKGRGILAKALAAMSPTPGPRGPFTETRLQGALAAFATQVKPRVLPFRLLTTKDLSIIMLPAIAKIPPGLARVRDFIQTFENRHQLPLLMQCPLFASPLPVIDSLPIGFDLNTLPSIFANVPLLLSTTYVLLVQLLPADLLVIHWKLGPVFCVKGIPSGERARLLFLGEHTCCLFDLGAKARTSLPVMQEFSSVHSWQVFGFEPEGGAGLIPLQFKEACRVEGIAGVWQYDAAVGPTIIFAPDNMIHRVAYPTPWLLVALTLGGSIGLADFRNLRQFSKIFPVAACPAIGIEPGIELGKLIDAVLGMLPSDASIALHGIRVYITWHDLPKEDSVDAFERCLNAPLVGADNFISYSRNSEKLTHLTIVVALFKDRSGDSLSGGLVKHSGPYPGPLPGL